ncbi:uncharacterized protein G2W53_001261 [Senna tora]|uniref:Uncharacterized protein n=1 Tax=Senna tora TaxID=362788 RepID=A0A834XI93_9FABA|nr:uncharacterized protein G2W53_001261 [Senna tora]
MGEGGYGFGALRGRKEWFWDERGIGIWVRGWVRFLVKRKRVGSVLGLRWRIWCGGGRWSFGEGWKGGWLGHGLGEGMEEGVWFCGGMVWFWESLVRGYGIGKGWKGGVVGVTAGIEKERMVWFWGHGFGGLVEG